MISRPESSATVPFGRRAGGSETVDVETAVTSAPARNRSSTAKAAPAQSNPEAEDDTQAALLQFDQAKWKPPELSKVIAYDPFALPGGFPRPSLTGLTMADGDAATAEEKRKQLADALAE